MDVAGETLSTSTMTLTVSLDELPQLGKVGGLLVLGRHFEASFFT